MYIIDIMIDNALSEDDYPTMVRAVAVYSFKEIPRHMHAGSWELHYILSGAGWFRNGTSVQRFGPGSLFFSPPNIEHEAESEDGEPFPYYHVLFDPDATDKAILEDIARGVGGPARRTAVQPFALSAMPALAGPVFNTLLLRAGAVGRWRAVGASAHFRSLLCGLADGEYEYRSRTESTFLDRTLSAMYASLTTDLDLDALAAEFSWDKSHLIRRFKAVTGRPPHGYFMDLKLKNAAFLLRHGELPVKAIAADLGFYDEFHFSKLFKKRFGVSPSGYRRGDMDPGNETSRMG